MHDRGKKQAPQQLAAFDLPNVISITKKFIDNEQ